MNRNVESHFAQLPNASISRARFDRSHDHKTAFRSGELVPILLDEILPGDTFTLDTSFVVRMATPIFPVMDNAYLDIYYYFVPTRLLWEHFEEFMGANKTGFWTQPTQYQIPQIVCDDLVPADSILDYLGVPTQFVAPGLSFSQLPVRAYNLIWNEWFRDENLQNPVAIPLGDSTITLPDPGTSIAPHWTIINANSGYCRPAPVARFHDYFSSALPEPQKGDPVSIPLGETAPVLTSVSTLVTGSQPALSFSSTTGSWSNLTTSSLLVGSRSNSPSRSAAGVETASVSPPTVAQSVYPNNLYADLSEATAATINSLRQAFQLQKLYEKDARGGTRYIEILKSHFGVSSPDARLQRPEYLGGKRVPINISQVLQTSGSDISGQSTPQGNTAAYSLTSDKSSSFTKSFVEHGYLIGLACVRTDHTYQQGLDKLWSRLDRFDFYWPVFASLGEQPIFNKEIYAYGTSSQMNEVFGYQEAWAEYRYKPSRVSGAFRSNYPSGSLDTWHFADNYSSLPILGDTWLREPYQNVERTLAVQNEPQFIADFYFSVVCTRPMPLYSIPGLIDHH